MINFMLENTSIKPRIFLSFYFSFKILIFYNDSFLSFHFSLFSWQRKTGFFRNLCFLGTFNNFWVDEEGFSEEILVCRLSAWHFFSLGCGDHGEVLSDLGCCKSYSIVFPH